MGWVKAFAVAAAIGMSGAVAPLTAQELKIGVMAQPSAMDPHFHNLTPNNSMLSHIFERLVETAADGKLKPGLATSWKTIDDTTWEFKLRPDV